jgi:hypothetical protein
LLSACYNGHVDVARWLRSDGGCNVHAVDEVHGCDWFHLSLSFGCGFVWQDESNAVALAIFSESLEMVSWLVEECGVDPNHQNVVRGDAMPCWTNDWPHSVLCRWVRPHCGPCATWRKHREESKFSSTCSARQSPIRTKNLCVLSALFQCFGSVVRWDLIAGLFVVV